MTVVSPSFYSPKTLTWQNEYFLDYLNTNDLQFLGIFKSMKVNDVCFAYNDHLLPRNHVSAYDANPTLNIKYSSIMDQDPWYQVVDGGVMAKVEAENYVPVTCVTDCKTSTNGLVWSRSVNISDYDGTQSSEIQPQPPMAGITTYKTLKNDIYTNKEVGITVVDTVFPYTPATIAWSHLKGKETNNEVVFVEGDLVIDENMEPTNYVYFIVSGSITIDQNVTVVRGMFFANKTITASGQNDNQLNISGSLYARGNITLNRTLFTKRENNTTPAVKVTYDPNLIFKLPKRLWEWYMNWILE